MKRLVFSEKSLDDLDGILHFIARDKPLAAIKFVDALKLQCMKLAETPHAGELREDLAPQLRVFSFRNYGIYFHAMDEGGIRIERVLHGAMDVSLENFH